MRAGDLHRARAEIFVRVVIGDDRDQPAVFLGADGDFAQLADDRRIAFVRRVHRNGAVAQHGFGARRGDRDIVPRLAQGDIPVFVLLDVFIGLAAGQRVLEVPHVARDLDILDLEIGNRGFKMRVPVHKPFAAIDQPLVEHVDKDLDDGVVEIRRNRVAVGIARRAAHGEGFARPVGRGTQALQLADDRAARLDLLFPDPFDERLAAHFGARGFAIGGHFAFGHQLGGDARVVGARLPKRVEPLHPLPADQDVLQRVVEGMANVQRPRHVRRRDHDREAFRLRGIRAGLEGPAVFPALVDPVFGLGRVEGLFHRHDRRLSFHRAGLPNPARKGQRGNWAGRTAGS